MTTWRCSHDSSHPTVESDIYPSFCLALIGARMKCSAHMEVVDPVDAAAAVEPRQTDERNSPPVALITVNSGAPDIEPGTFTVTLTDISGPRTIVPKSGPNAGEEVEVLDWTFATEDGQELDAISSLKTGPKSKTIKWLTAFFGAVPPPGASFDAKDIIGRMAIATVVLDEGGWPRIDTLSALPVARKPKAAAPAPEPVAAAVAVAEADEPADLPWK
jgi:hypothetical protein